MGLSTKEELKLFKKVVFEYPKEHEKLTQEISRLDNEINDLMHFLELGDLTKKQIEDVAIELQSATRRRREVKDREKELHLAINYISSLSIEDDKVNKLNGLIQRTANLEEQRKSRQYTVRVRKDLGWLLQ